MAILNHAWLIIGRLPDKSAWHAPGEVSKIRDDYREKTAYRNVVEMQKQRNVEVVRCINNEQIVVEMPMTWHERIIKNPRTADWMNQWKQWVDESVNQRRDEALNPWIRRWINDARKAVNQWFNEWELMGEIISRWNSWISQWRNEDMNQ